ncbi:E3 ubiquitin-protein ligase ZNF598-like isoform X2 [Copidosoma floridanum]|uniref:E3 ubiquitin-protein ligase ZNF598-like isoform X2 n=1 Tax=Copidosoma floridanum TaxID=29053 RepID=UPI0006C98C74|nr:E3 ubiquitin-protein ligase ZNF598-like isoform X2 [Copidosoma floridanum]
MQSTDTSSSSSTAADPTKGKAKKKKIKASSTNGNASIESSFASKLNKPLEESAKDSTKSKEVPEPSKKANGAATAAPVSIQRKLSELKIENLNKTNNTNHSSDEIAEVKTANKLESRAKDFPVLGRTPNRPPGLPSPPPGFAAPIVTNPPPGFQNRSNGLTFTNSSSESYAIVPDKQKHQSYTYLAPPGFQRRNQNLIAQFNYCFGCDESEELKAFRNLSGLYRTGACDAEEYYKRCRNVMGTSAFNRIFPELLSLLPDIKKQRELFEVHKRELGAGSTNKISGLVDCANCGQILRSSDLHDHASSHTLENHFPILSNTGPLINSWRRK